jgi:hypothetical protein
MRTRIFHKTVSVQYQETKALSRTSSVGDYVAASFFPMFETRALGVLVLWG